MLRWPFVSGTDRDLKWSTFNASTRLGGCDLLKTTLPKTNIDIAPEKRKWIIWTNKITFQGQKCWFQGGWRGKTYFWHVFLVHFVLLIQSFEVLPWHGDTLPSPWWRNPPSAWLRIYWKAVLPYFMWFYWSYWWQSSRNGMKWIFSLLNVLATTKKLSFMITFSSWNFEFPDFDTTSGEKKQIEKDFTPQSWNAIHQAES